MENIASIAKALKENQVDLATALGKVCEALCDHEQRLKELERPLDITTELKYLRSYVEGIEEPEKRKAALFCLASLCEALGIENLEK